MEKIHGFTLGHYTDLERNTGLTVFLLDKRSSCGYFLCGSAPALREVSLLDVSSCDQIDALVFSGGSAFGLGAANGVMRWLSERGKGFSIAKGVVPIVPTACIFDLGIQRGFYPSEQDAYQACEFAQATLFVKGRVGAGTGATAGVTCAEAISAHSSGFGYAIKNEVDGLLVAAFVVANPFGDIRDNQGNIVAGSTSLDGNFIDVAQNLPDYLEKTACSAGKNTTLVAIFTNAHLEGKQLLGVSKMASAGIARAISPSFTPFDGDVVFTVSVGNKQIDPVIVGHYAAEQTRLAILNAVT